MKKRMLTDFYSIETIGKEGGDYICKIRLNPAHDIYRGHFPGMPVLPGVCMLRIVKECVSAVLEMPVRFQMITSCKFLSVVNPVEQEVFNLVFSVKDSNGLQVVACVDEKTVLKLKASIVAEQ